ncbi:hypothetical protein CPB84DRAFT_1794502 [Gymnopilus junonius]|uniref:DUF3533 domain-containing protein n=1 Tax=Gymnopilus junonius TaxID=109634 RepID=A0A9P5NCV7_GYMJU|nr:hypothetical protein CPB84DRAFT_1794502 [Gymnopilus junonius]
MNRTHPHTHSHNTHSSNSNDAFPSPSSSLANLAIIPPNARAIETSSSPIAKYDELHAVEYNGDGNSTTRTMTMPTPPMTYSSGRTTLAMFHPHEHDSTQRLPLPASPTLVPGSPISHSHPHSLSQSNSNAKTNPSHTPPTPPFSNNFLDKNDEALRNARRLYLKIYAKGTFAVIVTIFIVFSLYWGSLWKIPAHAMKGWIVNFDGGPIGARVVNDLSAASGRSILWEVVPSTRFPNGPPDVISALKDNQAWVAVSINPGSSARYQNSLENPDPNYDGSAVVTAYGVEGRNENAFRVLIRPYMYNTLEPILTNYSATLGSQLVSSNSSASAADLVSLLSISPQTVTYPVGYTLVNLIPFAQPVASAVVFVGLIYLLILSFFIVAIAYNARHVSGLNNLLSLRSLIIVRLVSSMTGYFFLSFFYSLLNVAFKLNLSRKYGHAGFVIFWMLNWMGMLSVGLALESLITVLGPKWIPFFMIGWIIVNVSVCVFPIDVLPKFFRYGYAVPFYNISNSIRSITFGTKNTLGLNFGVLFIWVFISCLTLPAIQWFVRRQEARAKMGAGAGAAQGNGHEAHKVRSHPSSTTSTPELKSQSGPPHTHTHVEVVGSDQEKQSGR